MELGVYIPATSDKSIHFRNNSFWGMNYADFDVADWTLVQVDVSASATLTLTGVDNDPVVTTEAHFRVVNGLVSIRIAQAVGTASSTDITLTGLPEMCWPARDVSMLVMVKDDVTVQQGGITIADDGSITLDADGNGGAFAGTQASRDTGLLNLPVLTYEGL